MCTLNSFHKICEECGKPFTTGMATTRYCSERCSKLAYKHLKRDERLAAATQEVRERQRIALLDQNFLTITDAARLMQMSRNTLYKIIRTNAIPLKRFTDRTVRIARADLDKASEGRTTGINTPAPQLTDDLGKWMTREQVMAQIKSIFIRYLHCSSDGRRSFGARMTWIHSEPCCFSNGKRVCNSCKVLTETKRSITFAAAIQKSIMKQTPLYILLPEVPGDYCWSLQPMVSSDAMTERIHRISEGKE